MIFIGRNFIISVFTLIISFNLYAQVIQNKVEYNLASGVYNGTNLLTPTNLYSAIVDASRLASGVYICQLRVNDYVSSKKKLLLK